MSSSRGCRSSYDCIVKIKGVTTRPILFSQLMRSDGEGAMNPEELFADDRSPASEQERVHEDELHSLMRSILDWAISFLSESSQGTIRAIYFEGKTVKQHSEVAYDAVDASGSGGLHCASCGLNACDVNDGVCLESRIGVHSAHYQNPCNDSPPHHLHQPRLGLARNRRRFGPSPFTNVAVSHMSSSKTDDTVN